MPKFLTIFLKNLSSKPPCFLKLKDCEVPVWWECCLHCFALEFLSLCTVQLKTSDTVRQNPPGPGKNPSTSLFSSQNHLQGGSTRPSQEFEPFTRIFPVIFNRTTSKHFTQVFQWVIIIKYEGHCYVLGHLFNMKSSWQNMSQQGLWMLVVKKKKSWKDGKRQQTGKQKLLWGKKGMKDVEERQPE